MDFSKIPLICFYEDRHAYICRDAKLTSATGLIGKYEWDFEREYWLNSGAIKAICPNIWRRVKDRDYKGSRKPPAEFFWRCFEEMDDKQKQEVGKQKQILAWEWEMKNAVACYRGTNFHLKMEQTDINTPLGVLNPFTGRRQTIPVRANTDIATNTTVCFDLKNLKDGYYPELIIFHIEGDVGICGQIDRAWIWTDEKGGRHYYSDDWKTNWKKKDESGRNVFKAPLNHLRTSKDNTYALQASIYAYMMDLAGFNIAGIQITYVKDYKLEVFEERPLPYLREEVEQMFTEFFKW